MLNPKYKIGQKVKVVKQISWWNYGRYTVGWIPPMDRTLNKTYEIIEIDKTCYGYRLNTRINVVKSIDWDASTENFWYPEESLKPINTRKQLLFKFMRE